MADFPSLLKTGIPLIVPGAHDALTARLIELAGFPAYGIGGSALAATQLALPDVGLQSFGEYRDAVGRIMEGTSLPVVVDGENGFGDVKAVTRTVRSFATLGVAALALEDLSFPPVMGRRPTLIPRAEMAAKLRAAVAARGDSQMAVIARTDAAYVTDVDAAISRASEFESLGADAVLCTGMPDAIAYSRLRSAVRVPVVAVIVPQSPWYAPGVAELAALGIDCAMYPAVVLPRIVAAIRQGLDDLRGVESQVAPLPLAEVLRAEDWRAVEARSAGDAGG